MLDNSQAYRTVCLASRCSPQPLRQVRDSTWQEDHYSSWPCQVYLAWHLCYPIHHSISLQEAQVFHFLPTLHHLPLPFNHHHRPPPATIQQ